MKYIKLYYKYLGIISFFMGLTVVMDTFFLKQILKMFMVSANTSSYSPYNSDGVLNLIIMFFLLLVVPYIAYKVFQVFTTDEKNNDKEGDE